MASAPILGNSLTHYFGWQSNFVFMLIYALIVGGVVYFNFTETKPLDSMPLERGGTDKVISMSRYMLILNQPTFVYHACLCMFSMSVILAYVSTAPTWLMIDLGLSSSQFTMWFAINAIINIIACIYTSKVIDKFGVKKILASAITILEVRPVKALKLATSSITN